MLATNRQDEITLLNWQNEITSLQQSLNNEIKKISSHSEINIINHICINNLKSKLERLKEIEKILSIDKYKIVFIGTIGQGKTTAICHLFNLISDFQVSKNVGNKTKEVIETKELLSTGAGRTTICEVIIKAAKKTYIEIEPYSIDEMENIIFEFCESIANKNNPQAEQKIIISQEIERAIRNITEFTITSKTVYEGDKKKIYRTDIAKVIFEESGVDVLKKTALNNANLESRTFTTIEFDNQSQEQDWIKNTFAAINNVQLKKFAIPRRIYLYVSNDVLSGSNLSQFDSVVDTKGLDENPIRKDLQRYIDSQDTICLFVTPFAAAPEASITKLMGYHLTSKSKEFHHRFVTLVLPRKGEPEKVGGADGERDLGIQIRQEEVQASFKKLNLEFFQDNILFYDALRYYRDDIVKLHEYYEQEDVQSDKNEFIAAIADVVERRRNILLDEINNIRESFINIENGDALTAVEIQAIENAIQKIENLRDLGKRVPSFVYEDFIDKYLEYYRTTYKAWNTKHAIHRNFGYYEPRDIDIYYDAKVVAEGIDEDEMLKKFTREVKQELKNIILNEITSVNESLKTLIPDLEKEFYSLYDKFISQVGTEIQKELERQLSSQVEKSEFWEALLAEKGRRRKNGETFAGNVCEIFKQELEFETKLNQFLQSKTEYHWEQLVNKILGFFGEE
ncbi:MAG: hypothetical protein QNJ51_04910 [Calothrix sp. MO_167.B12]|nr:hypothetical protein [Calothrix sp. MO_167.B12]